MNSPNSSQETPGVPSETVTGETVVVDTATVETVASEAATAAAVSPDTSAGGSSATPSQSMQEYYQLQRELLGGTLIISVVIFVAVWIFYSLNIALNYFIGACTGVVYLKMLARNVEQLGREKKRLGRTQLAVLVVVIVIASRVEQLQVLPIFLGFLTYKAAVIFYMLRTTLLPESSGRS